MKSISLRNVPDDIYAALQMMAKSNRRSLQEQIKFILEQEVRLLEGSPIARAAKWRRKLSRRKFTDIVKMVKEDRAR